VDWTAIFVDAGYLYSAGYTALAGKIVPRHNTKLNPEAIVDHLKTIAKRASLSGSLLRIYWYDGVKDQRYSLDQEAIVRVDFVKFRVGIINNQGQQKGVDSLIVTDLIELARNKAISDAILFGGDEDLRVGVEVAQSLGVRVHLLGIEPSSGNQSRQLRNSADTKLELTKMKIGQFLTVFEAQTGGLQRLEPAKVIAGSEGGPKGVINRLIDSFITSLTKDDIDSLKAHFQNGSTIPRDFDSPWLGRAGSALARDLDTSERQYLRERFKFVIEDMASGPR
jgi:uncharacterized LabA/DUF88 family protein